MQESSKIETTLLKFEMTKYTPAVSESQFNSHCDIGPS